MNGPVDVTFLLWALWLASWLIVRGWSKETLVRPRRRAEAPYTLAVNLGFALVVAALFCAAGPRLWTAPRLAAWGLAGAAGLGFVLCWWARLHLGGNWSWGVTVKQSHDLVESGPYRFVRHPIYSGLILAAVATAALEGKLLSAAGCAAMIAGFLIKARLEERFLRSRLGAPQGGALLSSPGGSDNHRGSAAMPI